MNAGIETATLDTARIRADFPILSREVRGKPLVFLDSAASSQKPLPVLETMDRVYRWCYANVHRGTYCLSEEATCCYEDARDKVADFINTNGREEIVFTRNATESINLVAYSWGRANIGPGDRILLTELEHHSNIVPWQLLAYETGAELAVLPITGDALLDLDRLDDLLDERVKLVSFTEIVSYAMERLSELPGLHILGPSASKRGGVIAFTFRGIHPHDLAYLLDLEGVAMRAGHHCAQPLHRSLGLTATARASFYLYNTFEDVDRLVEALEKAAQKLGEGR